MKPSVSQPRSDRRRAATLVELLVGLGILAMLLAVLLNTFDQTQRLALREVRRNTAQQEALLTLHRLTSLIGDAVPLSALDAQSPQTEAFESDHLRIATWRGATAAQMWLADVQCASPEALASGEASITIRRIPIPGGPEPRALPQPHSVSVRFEYRDAHPSSEWESSLPAGKFPALIRIILSARDPRSEDRPYVLSTVVPTALVGGDW